MEKGLVKWKDGKVLNHYTKRWTSIKFVNALDEDEKILLNELILGYLFLMEKNFKTMIFFRYWKWFYNRC